MSERETKELITPAGKTLILKSYLNTGERNQIRKIYLEKTNLDATDGLTEFPAIVLDEVEKKFIEMVVVSYDGITENIYQKLMETMPDEYDFIVKEATKTSTGNFQTAM